MHLKIQMYRLLQVVSLALPTNGGKQCGPRSDCSYRCSLIWVHTVCHTGFLNISTDKKADDSCCDWRFRG